MSHHFLKKFVIGCEPSFALVSLDLFMGLLWVALRNFVFCGDSPVGFGSVFCFLFSSAILESSGLCSLLTAGTGFGALSSLHSWSCVERSSFATLPSGDTGSCFGKVSGTSDVT